MSTKRQRIAAYKRKRRHRKRSSEKRVSDVAVWSEEGWKVISGKLVPRPGRPAGASNLFDWVAEKLPFESLAAVHAHMKSKGAHLQGVYMAHDSMGVARYGGRGWIFKRLRSHRRKYRRELLYFSFYVVREKKHERELETAILRAAGPQMILNTQKVRDGIDAGSVRDYEPGTKFFQRRGKKGRRPKRVR